MEYFAEKEMIFLWGVWGRNRRKNKKKRPL